MKKRIDFTFQPFGMIGSNFSSNTANICSYHGNSVSLIESVDHPIQISSSGNVCFSLRRQPRPAKDSFLLPFPFQPSFFLLRSCLIFDTPSPVSPICFLAGIMNKLFQLVLLPSPPWSPLFRSCFSTVVAKLLRHLGSGKECLHPPPRLPPRRCSSLPRLLGSLDFSPQDMHPSQGKEQCRL